MVCNCIAPRDTTAGGGGDGAHQQIHERRRLVQRLQQPTGRRSRLQQRQPDLATGWRHVRQLLVERGELVEHRDADARQRKRWEF